MCIRDRPYLASAVPLGLANYVFDLENIESAHAAGDPYPTRQVMMANGLSSTLGAMFGNPFPVTVYILSLIHIYCGAASRHSRRAATATPMPPV